MIRSSLEEGWPWGSFWQKLWISCFYWYNCWSAFCDYALRSGLTVGSAIISSCYLHYFSKVCQSLWNLSHSRSSHRSCANSSLLRLYSESDCSFSAWALAIDKLIFRLLRKLLLPILVLWLTVRSSSSGVLLVSQLDVSQNSCNSASSATVRLPLLTSSYLFDSSSDLSRWLAWLVMAYYLKLPSGATIGLLTPMDPRLSKEESRFLLIGTGDRSPWLIRLLILDWPADENADKGLLSLPPKLIRRLLVPLWLNSE